MVATAILVCSLLLTDGHLTYTLDDPYTHLSLARSIIHGHYGINPGEWSAPASSILWPVLLAPLGDCAVADWVVLAINTACLLVTVGWLARLFGQYGSPTAAAILTLGLAWGLNLFGLVFTGMEHSLQLVMVTIVSVSLAGVPVSRPLLLACLTVMPWIRYEDLAISLPTTVYLLLTDTDSGRRIQVIGAAALSLGVVLGFSWFLHVHGLGWLPSSVTLKEVFLRNAIPAPRLQDLLNSIEGNYQDLQPFVLMSLAVAIVPALRRVNPPLSFLLLTTTCLVLCFGHSGWFGRLEVYYVAFASILSASILLPLFSQVQISRTVWLLVIGFQLMHPDLWKCTLETPLASRSVYEQQYQLAVIVRDYLKRPVAANDIGLVSWLGRQPVLDLWGLGSKDVLDKRLSDPSDHWLEGTIAEHSTDYIFIYSDWFHRIPSSWVKVAQLSLTHPRFAVAEKSVDLYAANSMAAERLADALKRYELLSKTAAGAITVLSD